MLLVRTTKTFFCLHVQRLARELLQTFKERKHPSRRQWDGSFVDSFLQSWRSPKTTFQCPAMPASNALVQSVLRLIEIR